MKLQTIQVCKQTYEKLKSIAEKRTMKLYGLITMILNEWLVKNKGK